MAFVITDSCVSCGRKLHYLQEVHYLEQLVLRF